MENWKTRYDELVEEGRIDPNEPIKRYTVKLENFEKDDWAAYNWLDDDGNLLEFKRRGLRKRIDTEEAEAE